MTIDVASFTPLRALLGGALIGLAAGWLLLARGRIAGISGLLAQVLPARGVRGVGWSLDVGVAVPFLLGLVLAPLLLMRLGWQGEPRVAGSALLLAIAGLLVGFGTRLANGCTSGHGVCGIARWSRRSLVATLLFMASAMATVWLQRAVP